MATNPTGESRVPLVQRVKNILTTPKTEWPVIDSEPDSIGGIYKNYVVILAATPPVCLLIGMLALGGRFLPMNFVIGQAVISYLIALASVYILALIIDALAPSFGGTKDRVKAFKVAAYASTAAWVAGIFNLLPPLAIVLALVGALYSLYLLYLGLPVLMKTPPDKSVVYTVAIVVAAIVINLVLAAIAAQLLWSLAGPTAILPAAYPG